MFNNKVIWITGASSGIGKAIALNMVLNGARVILSARRKKVLEDVKKACLQRGAEEDDILVLPLDMLEQDKFPAAVKQVMNHFGAIDMLFNNAGISQRSVCLETDMSTYRTLFEVDVFGQIALTKQVLPIMVKQASGHLVITSSIAGKIGVPFRTGYCAAKHAVMGFFDALRAELANTSIKVTTITPGFIRTSLSENALKGDGSNFGVTDSDIANGIDVDDCAKQIIKGFIKGKKEIVVAGRRELSALRLKRFFPNILFSVIAKIVTKPAATKS
ncbi:MAG: short chain dehydrogenase [Gammaproteobacteria bacterium]|nr:MAG: short chain dehydrogenase [Gammaproteobacteria bacterium]